MIIAFSCVEKLEKQQQQHQRYKRPDKRTNKVNIEQPQSTSLGQKSISNRSIYYLFMLNIFLRMCACMLTRAHTPMIYQQKEYLSREWCVCV